MAPLFGRFQPVDLPKPYDNIGQLKSAIGTGGDSTENLGYAYDTAWNLSTRTNYGEYAQGVPKGSHLHI